MAASLAAGTLTFLGPVATAAPCEPWPPAGGGGAGASGSLSGGSLSGGSLSGSLGTPPSQNQPAPWYDGGSGYIPRLEGRTNTVELLTGPTSPNDTVKRFGITGTDLGIMWDNGDADKPQVLMALGDTMGDCIGDAQWRSNILFRSSNRDLANGMRIDNAPMERPGLAKSILPRQNVPGEVTVIPTAGVEVGGTQYLRYMSVASWDEPGEWTTNYSALASSTDNGENWAPIPGSARIGRGSTDLVPDDLGKQHTFHVAGQMSAYLKYEDDGDDFIYEYLTPSGRSGSAILARVPEAEIENLSAYTFWDGSHWVADQEDAAVVLGGQVSELSVSWSEHLGRFIALHNDENNDIVLRQSPDPEGPWSGKDILVSFSQVPTLYGAYVHPWSPAVETDGRDLFFTMSTWDAYNVFLMRTDLSTIEPRIAPHPRARMGIADDSWTRDSADPADTGETVVTYEPLPEA